MLAAPVQNGVAQAARPPRTTKAGVYTLAQASRGKDMYSGMCKGCHTPASHTGVTFKNWWEGHPLSDLFMYMVNKMPKNDPGSLALEDYADLVAYLLRMNAMPPGQRELPPDSAALARIKISTAKGP